MYMDLGSRKGAALDYIGEKASQRIFDTERMKEASHHLPIRTKNSNMTAGEENCQNEMSAHSSFNAGKRPPIMQYECAHSMVD